MKAAVLFDLFGPYHWARLNAAGLAGEVTGIELFGSNVEYPWSRVGGTRAFHHVNLFPDGNRQSVPPREARARLKETLDGVRPAVVFIPGWSDYWALAALRWCLQNGTPAVVMSESTAGDEPRRAWREALKSRIISLCAAGLVGGGRHREYLRTLGMPDARIFTGYDVVDNRHFSEGADRARAGGSPTAPSPELKSPYFLASSRFVPKKNIFRLLEAYQGYRQLAGEQAWKLVLLGGGQLQAEVVRRGEELGGGGAVVFPGFRQYDELPAYYGWAGVFVHASVSEQWGLVVNEAMAAGLPVLVSDRCGCAPDLVRPGRNGHTFDPCDVDGLTQLLWKMAQPATDRTEMGAESRRIIANWSPEHFARSLWRAAEAARAAGPVNARPVSRWLLEILLRRR